MAITKEQAINPVNKEFHYDAGHMCEKWRRNGQTKTWVTRPEEFRIPVKFGLYRYSYLTERNASQTHLASECGR